MKLAAERRRIENVLSQAALECEPGGRLHKAEPVAVIRWVLLQSNPNPAEVFCIDCHGWSGHGIAIQSPVGWRCHACHYGEEYGFARP